MPLRLLGIIFIFVLILVFIGFNLGEDHRSNISFGFTQIENVPVFYTIFVSFILGVLVTLPLALRARLRHSDITQKPVKEKKKLFEKKNLKDSPAGKAADIAKEFDEPPPSYSGGKYFDKDKYKK